MIELIVIVGTIMFFILGYVFDMKNKRCHYYESSEKSLYETICMMCLAFGSIGMLCIISMFFIYGNS